MKKNLFVLLAALTGMSFASSVDMTTLSCKSTKLNASTTLANVQNNCLIKKQTQSKGRFEVEFVNSTTNKTVTCYFASKQPTALLNSCK